MKLKRSILLLCLAASLGVSAQNNVNVDNLRLTYRERLMPTSPQYPVLFYYSTRIDLPNSMTRYIYPPDVEQGLFIEGQRYTNQPVAGDYMITAYLQPIEIVKNEMMERMEEKTDNDGRPYREYYFWVEIAYTFAANGTFSRNTNVLDKTELANRRKVMTFRSPEYTSRRTASNYWHDNKEILIEDFTRRCTAEAVASYSSQLTRRYGFVITSTSGLIKTINEKKHPENEAFRAASNALKSRMQSLDGTRPLADDEMNDLIAYFESIPQRYTDPKLKADVRLRYAAYYNLCRIYIYTDQPEKVKYYADLLEENGYDKKDGGRLIKDANNLQKKLDKSYFKRSQFDPDLFYEDNRLQEDNELKKEDWIF